MGQVNPDSEFGRAIIQVATSDNLRTFCEVGTWNGQGSTQCLYNGIQGRPDAHLYSIEGVPDMYARACAFWGSNPQVTLLYGTLHRSILGRDEVERHPAYLKIYEHYDLHYRSEREAVQTAPLVEVPPCDAILLDGGEFSTQGDWDALYHDGLKVVMLDDTQIIKTSDIYAKLKVSPEWACTHDFPHDRNGWAIFQRR